MSKTDTGKDTGHGIAVIIVEYNTPERTARYVQDLVRSCDEPSREGLSFVIVDNSCRPDNEGIFREALARYQAEETAAAAAADDAAAADAVGAAGKTGGGQHFPPLTYVHAPSNLGFARGNNLGVKHANELYDPEYYLFSNTDIELPEKLELSRLQKVLEEHPEMAVAGPRVTGPDGVTQSPSPRPEIVGRHIISNLLWPVNLFIPAIHKLNRYAVDDPVTGPAYYVVGAFMLVRRSSFEAVGGFDEHTFLYMEEGILAERLRRLGLGEYYVDEVAIRHEEGGSTGSTRTRDRKALDNLLKKRKRVFDSEMYYFRKYRKTPDLLLSAASFSFAFFCLKLRLYTLLMGTKGRKLPAAAPRKPSVRKGDRS